MREIEERLLYHLITRLDDFFPADSDLRPGMVSTTTQTMMMQHERPGLSGAVLTAAEMRSQTERAIQRYRNDPVFHARVKCLVMDILGPIREQLRERDALLMAVGNKYQGESRFQTALRYIQQAEQGIANES